MWFVGSQIESLARMQSNEVEEEHTEATDISLELTIQTMQKIFLLSWNIWKLQSTHTITLYKLRLWLKSESNDFAVEVVPVGNYQQRM